MSKSLTETALRKRAARRQMVMRKSRRAISLENHGEYMLIDASTGFSLLGFQFDAGLEDINDYLNEYDQPEQQAAA